MMRNVAISLAAILFAGCAERPPGNVEDVLPMQPRVRSVHASNAAQSVGDRYDPNIIGLDIATTSEYSAQAAPSTSTNVQSAPTVGPVKNPPSPKRHSVAAHVNASERPATQPGVEARVLSDETRIAVDGAGSTVPVDGDRSGIKAPPAQSLYDPAYPKPSFVKPDELSQRPDTTAPGEGTSPTVYPTRGQAAQNNDSPTLYPPSGRFSDPGSPSLYPRGPTAPSGFRGQ